MSIFKDASSDSKIALQQPSKLILVTGASGFLGSHILRTALLRGYRVRATVRSQAKAQSVKNAQAQFSSNLEISIVPNIAVSGAYDGAVKGVSGVIHSASPFRLDVSNYKKDLLEPAVSGTVSLLESIQKYAPQVKRVVCTSSVDAILHFDDSFPSEHVYTEVDWNPVKQEEAEQGPAAVAYSASKTFAERAAHDFVELEKPGFTVATINPPFIFGPICHDVGLENLNLSMQELWQYINGSLRGRPIPETEFPVFADVRDVAEAHLRAFEGGTQSENERFIVIAGEYQNKDIAKVIRENFPELADRLPDPESASVTHMIKIDPTKAVRDLKMSYLPFEEVIKDSIKSLLQLGKEAGAASRS